jgi:hypothetical protein
MATNINDLPMDPIGQGPMGQGQGQQEGSSLDGRTINQIVNGLQQASMSGATTLPSRDIPMNTDQLTTDSYIQPNYVPPPAVQNYIEAENDNLQHYYAAEKRSHSLDSLYDEIQGPLLMAILYFLFQLPVFRRSIYHYFPFLCFVDGSYNFQGLLFVSALFGGLYYMLTKTMKNFSKF